MCVIDVYLFVADIKEHVKQIEKAVSGKEPRFVLRALRALPSTSRRLNPNVLHKAVSGFYTSNAAGKEFLLSFLEEVSLSLTHTHCKHWIKTERIFKCSVIINTHLLLGEHCVRLWGGLNVVVCVFNLSLYLQPMDTEGDVQFRPRTGKAAAAPLIPEVEAYLQLLLLVYLINNKRYPEVQGGGCVSVCVCCTFRHFILVIGVKIHTMIHCV